MKWIEPNYSRKQVKKAGDHLVNADINSAVNHAKWGKQDSFEQFTMREYMKPPIPFQTTLATA